MIGNTVVIEGDFVEADGKDIDGSGGLSRIPFRFVSDLRSTIQLNPSVPLEIGSGGSLFLFIAARIDSWLDPALPDLQDLNASDLTEGRVILSSGTSSSRIRSLVTTIESSIRTGFKLGRGNDADFEEADVEEDSSSSSEE